MFDLVDRMLLTLLDPVLSGRGEITFATPGPGWAERVADKPALSVFLHRVEEDSETRVEGWLDQRDADGHVTARLAAPRVYRVGYLITAWAGDVLREHAMLGAALRLLSARESLPAELVGEVGSAEHAVSLTVAGPHRRSPVELWSALGIAPRASLDVEITAPLLSEPVTELSPAPAIVELGARQGGTRGAPARGGSAERPRGRVTEPR